MKILVAVFLSFFAALLILTGCKSSRKANESAPYRLVLRDGSFELRDYADLTVVETGMGSDSGSSFQRLFRYISGGNAAGEKIPMTTPVFMEGRESRRSMSFVMPATLKSVPTPNDPAVRVATIPAGRFAVFRFSGARSTQAEVEAVEKLKAWTKSRRFAESGSPVFGYFDPPWTPPFLRRNEVMLRLKAEASGESLEK